MVFAKILHILGLVLWLGGGTAAALTMVFLGDDAKDTRISAAKALRKVTLLIVTPGMLLALAGGLVMLIPDWSELYAKAPWMHTKLLVGVIATGISGALTGRLRKAGGPGGDPSPTLFKVVAGVLAACAFAGIVSVMTRFGAH